MEVYTFRYYQSFTYAGVESAGHYWVDLNASENVVINEMLSTSHRRAAVSFSLFYSFYSIVSQFCGDL